MLCMGADLVRPARSGAAATRFQHSRALRTKCANFRGPHAPSTAMQAAAAVSSGNTCTAAANAETTAMQNLLVHVVQDTSRCIYQDQGLDVEPMHLQQLQHSDEMRLQQQLEQLHQQQHQQQHCYAGKDHLHSSMRQRKSHRLQLQHASGTLARPHSSVLQDADAADGRFAGSSMSTSSTSSWANDGELSSHDASSSSSEVAVEAQGHRCDGSRGLQQAAAANTQQCSQSGRPANALLTAGTDMAGRSKSSSNGGRQHAATQPVIDHTPAGLPLMRLHGGSKPAQVAVALSTQLLQERQVVLSAAGAELALAALHSLAHLVGWLQQQQPGLQLLVVPHIRSSKRPGGQGKCQVYDLVCCLQHCNNSQETAAAAAGQKATTRTRQRQKQRQKQQQEQTSLQQQEQQQRLGCVGDQHTQQQHLGQPQLQFGGGPQQGNNSLLFGGHHTLQDTQQSRMCGAALGVAADGDVHLQQGYQVPDALCQLTTAQKQHRRQQQQWALSVPDVAAAEGTSAATSINSLNGSHTTAPDLQPSSASSSSCSCHAGTIGSVQSQQHWLQQQQHAGMSHVQPAMQPVEAVRWSAGVQQTHHTHAHLHDGHVLQQQQPAYSQLSWERGTSEQQSSNSELVSAAKPVAQAGVSQAATVQSAAQVSATAAAADNGTSSSASLVQQLQVRGSSFDLANAVEDALRTSAAAVSLPVAHAKQAVKALEAAALLSKRWRQLQQQQQRRNTSKSSSGGKVSPGSSRVRAGRERAAKGSSNHSSSSSSTVHEPAGALVGEQLVILPRRHKVLGQHGMRPGMHVYIYAAPFVN